MIVAAAVYVLLTLSNVKAESHTSRLYVEEGKNVTLRCVFPGGNGSDLQWLTPRGYTSYFNGEKVLKDIRHQLVESSRNRLIIRLSNMSRADEGLYTCLYYSSPVQTKRVQVSVLAPPSPPSIDVIRIPGKGLKEKILLTCTTSGGRPCPRLTWLINDHTELFGHHNRRLESDGKCTAVSTLRVSAASHTSRVRCVVRHKILTRGNLTTSYSFHTLSMVTDSQINENTHHLQSAPDTTDVYPTSTINEMSSTAAETTGRDTTEGVDDGWISAEMSTFTVLSEENSSLVTDVTITGNSNNTTHRDVESSRRESYRTFILVLVSLMLCVLLVIVYLFLLKLRKAHYTWKKENETSEQTLESTRSRSNNEEMSSQNKNVIAATAAPANGNHKVTGIQYNNQVSM
ncbi:cytotoxic and regulatory T-cell molecule [Leptodactylus fuscus]|uniref:cytotoxic and regulatory T-cell molecule n=1 Tax=Leptodactylus fuscus TaxID=238119 RepID=UPI003F4E4BB5